jgi:hypothetical protein
MTLGASDYFGRKATDCPKRAFRPLKTIKMFASFARDECAAFVCAMATSAVQGHGGSSGQMRAHAKPIVRVGDAEHITSGATLEHFIDALSPVTRTVCL